jgi:hypothetical protein
MLAFFAPQMAAAASPEINVDLTPVLGGSALESGWNEVVARVENVGAKPARGYVELTAFGYVDRHGFVATAPFNVGPGATALVKVPAYAAAYTDIAVRAVAEDGTEITSTRFSPTMQARVLLLDVTEPSSVRAAINEASVSPSYAPSIGGMPGLRSPPSPPVLSVSSPRFDPATGDPVLPDRPALYAPASAVLLRSDVLTRVAGAELEALAGWILSGGTLAIAVVRPEDLRHPTITAFVGGEAVAQAVHAATLKPFSPPSPTPGAPTPGKSIPAAARPSEAVGKALAGYAGGNLHGTIYGSSAYYGLGEVHLLAFDPTRRPAADDPWAQARLVDLVRRGFDRRASLVFRTGDDETGDVAGTRKQLDPNEGSRWAIGVAALLLCIYAVIAGPINFSIASRAGKPLRALRWLPAIAAGAFLLVVAIGVAAKGVRGRARRLSLIEAGAGMTKGAVRRWRGLFTRGDKDLMIRASDASAVVRQAIPADSHQSKDHLVVDRDGARLVDVTALPWQTIVVREDGVGALGDGISVLKEAANDVAIVNRSGRDMRAVLLSVPRGDTFYFPKIKDGERVASSRGTALSVTTDGSAWLARIASGTRLVGVELHPLAAVLLSPVIGKDAPHLAEAWAALEEAAGQQVDWLPDSVPVVLAQLDGGEGRARDAGLAIESDRLLVRIVGYGGLP